MSWSVRHRGDRSAHVEASVRTVLVTAFPETAGYEFEIGRLSGPMRGSVFTVSRGDFRARISLQRYRRGPRGAADTEELRLYGSAGSARMQRARRAGSRWLTLARAAQMGVGIALFLGVAWGLTALLGHSLLAAASPLWVATIVPAGLLAWMGGVTARGSVGARGRRALAAASCDAVRDHRLAADLRAWSATARALVGQRELALSPAGDQPFRARALQAAPDQ